MALKNNLTCLKKIQPERSKLTSDISHPSLQKPDTDCELYWYAPFLMKNPDETLGKFIEWVGNWQVPCKVYHSVVTTGCAGRAGGPCLLRTTIGVTIRNLGPKLKHDCARNTSYCFPFFFFLDICVFSNVPLLKQNYNQWVKLSGISCYNR